MSVCVEAFLSHNLPSIDASEEVLRRLRDTLPAALAVREYWNSVGGNNSSDLPEWHGDVIHARLPHVRFYDGPGFLRIVITCNAVLIHPSAWYRGFLTIPSLRSVHVAAFRAIATAMSSPSIAICSDIVANVGDIFFDNGTQEACIAEMRRAMGEPQPSVETLSPAVTEAERWRWDVWFLL